MRLRSGVRPRDEISLSRLRVAVSVTGTVKKPSRGRSKYTLVRSASPDGAVPERCIATPQTLEPYCDCGTLNESARVAFGGIVVLMLETRTVLGLLSGSHGRASRRRDV